MGTGGTVGWRVPGLLAGEGSNSLRRPSNLSRAIVGGRLSWLLLSSTVGAVDSPEPLVPAPSLSEPAALAPSEVDGRGLCLQADTFKLDLTSGLAVAEGAELFVPASHLWLRTEHLTRLSDGTLEARRVVASPCTCGLWNACVGPVSGASSPGLLPLLTLEAGRVRLLPRTIVPPRLRSGEAGAPQPAHPAEPEHPVPYAWLVLTSPVLKLGPVPLFWFPQLVLPLEVPEVWRGAVPTVWHDRNGYNFRLPLVHTDLLRRPSLRSNQRMTDHFLPSSSGTNEPDSRTQGRGATLDASLAWRGKQGLEGQVGFRYGPGQGAGRATLVAGTGVEPDGGALDDSRGVLQLQGLLNPTGLDGMSGEAAGSSGTPAPLWGRLTWQHADLLELPLRLRSDVELLSDADWWEALGETSAARAQPFARTSLRLDAVAHAFSGAIFLNHDQELTSGAGQGTLSQLPGVSGRWDGAGMRVPGGFVWPQARLEGEADVWFPAAQGIQTRLAAPAGSERVASTDAETEELGRAPVEALLAQSNVFRGLGAVGLEGAGILGEGLPGAAERGGVARWTLKLALQGDVSAAPDASGAGVSSGAEAGAEAGAEFSSQVGAGEASAELLGTSGAWTVAGDAGGRVRLITDGALQTVLARRFEGLAGGVWHRVVPSLGVRGAWTLGQQSGYRVMPQESPVLPVFQVSMAQQLVGGVGGRASSAVGETLPSKLLASVQTGILVPMMAGTTSGVDATLLPAFVPFLAFSGGRWGGASFLWSSDAAEASRTEGRRGLAGLASSGSGLLPVLGQLSLGWGAHDKPWSLQFSGWAGQPGLAALWPQGDVVYLPSTLAGTAAAGESGAAATGVTALVAEGSVRAGLQLGPLLELFAPLAVGNPGTEAIGIRRILRGLRLQGSGTWQSGTWQSGAEVGAGGLEAPKLSRGELSLRVPDPCGCLAIGLLYRWEADVARPWFGLSVQGWR